MSSKYWNSLNFYNLFSEKEWFHLYFWRGSWFMNRFLYTLIFFSFLYHSTAATASASNAYEAFYIPFMFLHLKYADSWIILMISDIKMKFVPNFIPHIKLDWNPFFKITAFCNVFEFCGFQAMFQWFKLLWYLYTA